MKFRYLFNIAYMGKPFRGCQRQVAATQPRLDDPLTVQGRLEMACKLMRPLNTPIVVVSSRTDSGVNAFNTTCHVDLTNGTEKPYNTTSLKMVFNKYFCKNDLPIRILSAQVVPNTFHCRRDAISRTYLYRLILVKRVNSEEPINPLSCYIPIEELDRCVFHCTAGDLDLDVMKEGAKMLEGYHDFRTFMKTHQGGEMKITRKTIESIKIYRTPFIFDKIGYSSYSWPETVRQNGFDYSSIDIYIKADGFLYRQVRRIIGALFALAQGKIYLKDIKFMLEIPSNRSWLSQIKTFPAKGLYLCQVDY